MFLQNVNKALRFNLDNIHSFFKGTVMKFVKKIDASIRQKSQNGNVVTFFNLSLLEVGLLYVTSSCVFNGAC